MSDDEHDGFADSDDSAKPIDDRTIPRDEPLGVAWGFVVFVLSVALLAIFVFQNTESVGIQFLWLQLEMSLWMVVVAIVLLTLVFDQIISFFYRRRKRKERAARRVEG